MASPRGQLFVTPTAAGNLFGISASIPSLADSLIVQSTATLTFWSTGATPNGSVGLWISPGVPLGFAGPISQLQFCAQGAGGVAFEFYIGNL